VIDEGLARLADNLFWTALVVYAVAMLVYFYSLAYRRARASTIATVIAWGGALTHIASVASRGLSAGRVPWGNMFEYSSMIGLLIVLAYLVIIDARMKLRALGGFVMGAGVLSLASARFVYAPAGPLVPALNSYWLKIHVIAAITGSMLFGLSFIFTALYFLKDRAERRTSTFAGSTVGAASLIGERVVSDLDDEETGAGPSDVAPGGLLARLPSATRLDTLALRTIQFAFPIWTFAVMAGAVWAHEAWGRYWGWDPKETWAFITWVVYAGYLHARSTAGWRGRRSAIISAVGFGCVLFTYFAVNLWISGLHSYAK